jgi:phage-related protein
MGGLSEAQQAQAAATIFGQEAMSGMLAIINASDKDFEKLTEAIYGSEGAAKKMEETMNDTFEGSLAMMKSALQALGIEIGESLIPVLKLGAKAIATLASWLAKMPDPIRNVIVVLALLVAAIGPVVWMLGSFVTNAIAIGQAWGRLSTAFKAGEGVFKLIKPLITGITTGLKGLVTKVLGSVIPALQSLWGFLLANPITLVIAAIAALVAAFIYCWNNVDGFKEFWIDLWENVKSFCKDAIDAIIDWVGQFVEDLRVFWTEKVPEAGQKVIDWFQQLPERIGEFLSNAIDKVKNWVVEFAQGALEAGKQFLDNVIQFICQLPEQIWYWLVFCVAYVVLWSKQMIEKAIETGKQFLENIINFFKELPGKVLEFLTNAKNNVVQWSTEMTNKAIETGTNFLNNIVTFFKELPGRILDFITQAKQNVIQWATEMSSKARETGTNFLNNTIEFFKQLPGNVAQWLKDTVSRVTQWATEMMNKAREAGSKFLENVSQFIRQLPGKIAEWLNQVIAKVRQWAIDMGNRAREAGQKVYDNVIKPIKELPGKMVQLGRDIISGIINGITGAAGRLYNKMKSIATDAINAAKEKLGIHSPSRVFADEVGTQIPAGIEQGILNGQRELLNTIDSMSNDLVVGASVDTTKLGSMNIQPNMSATSNSTLMAQLLNELHKLNDKRTEYNINIDKVNADNPNDIRRLAEELEAFKRYKTTF